MRKRVVRIDTGGVGVLCAEVVALRVRRRCSRVPGALVCYAGRVRAVAGRHHPHASGTRPPAMSAATPEVRGPPADAPPVALPRIKPEFGLNDATLFAVYCFIKNFIG